MNIQVTFEAAKVIQRIKKATKIGQFAMAQQALKDSNFYAKQDSGIMIASSIKSSKLKKGLLIWDTVYSRPQYYLKAASKDSNPNAREMWAHYAATRHKKDWEGILQQSINEGV